MKYNALNGLFFAGAVVLAGGASVASADSCRTGMSLDAGTSPMNGTVGCLIYNQTDVNGPEEPEAAEGFLESALGLSAGDVTGIGKDESGGGEGTVALTFSHDGTDWNSTTGAWASNSFTSATDEILIVALKWNDQLVEFHNLGAVATASKGFWETDTACSLPTLVECSGSYGLSNVTFFTAADDAVFPPGEVPLPAAAWMFLSGVGLYGWVRRGKKSSSAA